MPRSKDSGSKKSAPKKPSPPQPAEKTKKGPRLLAQTAFTAAGVAVGSSIGHVVGHKLAGGGAAGGESTHGGSAECDVEWKAFLACSEKNDRTMCNEAMKNFANCLKKFDKTE